MRTLLIRTDLQIETLDQRPEEWMQGVDWDAVRFTQGHDAFVEQDALFAPGTVFVTLGDKKNMPLPAYVVGVDGEHMADATITEEELTKLIT